MKKEIISSILVGILFTFFASSVFAQCEDCPKASEQKIDFCYKDANFPKQCAQFMEKAAFIEFWIILFHFPEKHIR